MEETRRGAFLNWIVGGALVIALAALLLGLVPLRNCPACRGAMGFARTYPCGTCGDRLKISVWEERRGVERDSDRY